MDKKDLCTFMCGGVAARIADQALWCGVRILIEGLGKTLSARIMNNSIARRVVNERFARAIVGVTRLLQECIDPQLKGCKFLLTNPFAGDTDAMCQLHAVLLRKRECAGKDSVAEYLKEYRRTSYRWRRDRAKDLAQQYRG